MLTLNNAGYPEDSIIEEGYYIDNRKNGVWRKYYNSGQIKSKGEYLNNRPNGYYHLFYDNGILQRSCSFFRGRNYGEFLEFYENGQIKVKIIYPDTINSPLISTEYLYYPTGCLKAFHSNLCDSITAAIRVDYSIDSCGLVTDTTLYPRFKKDEDSLIWDKSVCSYVNYEVKKSDSSISHRSKIVRHSYLYSDFYISSQLQNKKLRLRDEFYNNLIFRGSIKNKKVWNGKFYFFSDETSLYRIEKWRKGKLKKVKEYP